MFSDQLALVDISFCLPPNSWAFSCLLLLALVQPRQLHNTQWGMMCPVETPEGKVSFVYSI